MIGGKNTLYKQILKAVKYKKNQHKNNYGQRFPSKCQIFCSKMYSKMHNNNQTHSTMYHRVSTIKRKPPGGGGTLTFSYIRRLGPFFGVQNFEFRYFLGFSEK